MKKEAWRHKWMNKRDVWNLLVLRMAELKVGTNDLLSVAKKKVTATAALVSSTKALPMVGLALQLEVPTMVAASIPNWNVGEEC
jgi:hypothetical protein